MSGAAVAVRADSGRAYLEGIRDSYTPNAKTFFRFLDAEGRGLTIDALRDYFTWLDGQGYRASTVRIKRQAAIDRVRRLFAIPGAVTPEQAARLEWAINDINRDNRAPKLQFQTVGREKVLPIDDYRRALAGCHSARQRCFLRFLYATGARVSEMTGARLADCTEVLGRVYIVVMGKGRKERTLRITAELFAEIRAAFNGSTWLFETSEGKPYARQYVSAEIRKVTARGAGRPLSAHKMRHSFATRMLGNGVPVDSVSRYLGHSDTSITLKYYAHNEIKDSELFDEDI